MKPLISPSILSADFSHLADEMDMLNRSEADWIHLDIMDGVFVPNISFGFPVLKHVSRLTRKPLDVHLMIVQPEKFIPEVKALGAHVMNVHYEACPHLHRVVQQIRDAGMQPAVTINPATPVSLLKDIVGDLYMVLVMGVNPGFGGQKFIEHTVDKVRELRELLTQTGSEALIEVDGGVNLETGARLVEAGADILVVGNAIFSATDPWKSCGDSLSCGCCSRWWWGLCVATLSLTPFRGDASSAGLRCGCCCCMCAITVVGPPCWAAGQGCCWPPSVSSWRRGRSRWWRMIVPPGRRFTMSG